MTVWLPQLQMSLQACADWDGADSKQAAAGTIADRSTSAHSLHNALTGFFGFWLACGSSPLYSFSLCFSSNTGS